MTVSRIAAAVLLGICVLLTATASYARCPNGYYENREGTCTRNGSTHCANSVAAGAGGGLGVSCNNQTSSGCCFNSTEEVPASVKDRGFFCCRRGFQCVSDANGNGTCQ